MARKAKNTIKARIAEIVVAQITGNDPKAAILGLTDRVERTLYAQAVDLSRAHDALLSVTESTPKADRERIEARYQTCLGGLRTAYLDRTDPVLSAALKVGLNAKK